MIDKRTRLVAAGYDHIADVYASWVPSGNDGTKGRYLARLERLVEPGSDVLDLGCGTGAHTTKRLAAAYNVVGVDISTRSVATRTLTDSRRAFHLG